MKIATAFNYLLSKRGLLHTKEIFRPKFPLRTVSNLSPERSDKKEHIPVMLEEVIENLDIKDNSIFLDLTFGAGGHTEEILKRYPCSKVFALDRDAYAIGIAKRLEEKYRCVLFCLQH